MPYYKVTVEVYVEAEDEDEALEEAWSSIEREAESLHAEEITEEQAKEIAPYLFPEYFLNKRESLT